MTSLIIFVKGGRRGTRSHAGGRRERAKGHLVHAVVRRRAPVTGPVRVVIADDEPLIRAGLRAISKEPAASR